MKIKFLLILQFILFGLCINAAIPVKVMELESVTPAETFYTGKVEAIEKGRFSFDIEGKLEYIKNAGDYVFQEIYDKENKKVVREGTVVASYDTTRQKFALKEAVMSMKIAEAELNKTSWSFDRYKKLHSRSSISGKEFLEAETDYMNAKLKLRQAENNLAKAKYDIDACKIVAPFSGIVSNVFVSQGTYIGKGNEVVELTKMTPILIKVPFPEEIVSNFTEGADVYIYPVSGGKPVSAWCRTGLSGNMLYAYIDNSIIEHSAVDGEKKFKKIYEVFPVKRISTSSVILNELGSIGVNIDEKDYPLAVPEKSIRTDDKGFYVLSAVKVGDYKDLSMFKLEKVSIVPGGITRDFNLGANRDVKIKSLKDSGSLKEKDSVLLLGEKGLKDGDTVVLVNLRWRFVPDQLVKVNIPSLYKSGIYVTAKAIIHQADSDNYVYIIEDKKAKLVNVNVVGRCSGNNRIEGKGIVAGAKVILFDRPELSRQLYDGAPVEVVEVVEKVDRIKYKRADRLIMGIPEIEKTYF